MNLRLPPALAERMRRHAARVGVSQQEIVRSAVARFLDAEEARELDDIPAAIRPLVHLPDRAFTLATPDDRVPLPDGVSLNELVAWSRGHR